MLFGQLAELAGRGLQKFRVGREGDVLGLHRGVHRGVHRDPGQIALAQGTGVVGNPQAFLQQNLQLVADAFSPVAHAGTLVRQVMLEKFLTGEVPETGVVHPAVPDLLVGEGIALLQQEHADHEAHRLRRAALVGKTLRQLRVEPGPVDLVRQDGKFVFHIDDLIEARPEKIVVTRSLLLFRSHLNPRMEPLQGITNGPKNESQIARKRSTKTRFLANPVTSNQRKITPNQWRPRCSQRTI